MGKKNILLFFICCFLSGSAYADQPESLKETSVAVPAVEPVTIPEAPNAVLSTPIDTQSNDTINQDTPKLFSLGRSVGASYFHLIDLYDKAKDEPFSSLQQEYNDTFQNFNIIDIILDDLNINGKSRQDLNKLRSNFYNALKNQDLNEIQVAFVRDMFVIFYENLSNDIQAKYNTHGSWLLSLGFYTSFQLESLNSAGGDKILLSGFDKILKIKPVELPENIYNNFLAVYNLDKLSVTQTELSSLKTNLLSISEYFTNYPKAQPLFGEAENLAGVWQGILINPENEKYDIRLTVNKDLTAKMDINGIAGEVAISSVRIVNNYFTFMFKPFGTEKLYLRFDARLSENMFTGEITDVLGSKGYWVLARCNESNQLSEEKLDTMTSYIANIEEKLAQTNIISSKEFIASEEKTTTACDETFPCAQACEAKPISEINNIISEINLPPLEEQTLPPAQDKGEIPVNNLVENKGFWGKIGDFFKKLF